MNARVNLITQSAYARQRGVAKSAVARAVSEGRISLIDGKIDPAVADIQWARNTRARADSGRAVASNLAGEGSGTAAASEAPQGSENAPPDAGSGSPSYSDYRARTEKATAEKAERENARAAGRLVERDRAERAAFDAFRELRDRVFSTPQRSAPRVVGMVDVREIEALMTTELQKAFEGWEARMLERLPKKDDV